jgi:hypothetical protein
MVALHIGVLFQQEKMRTDTRPFLEKFDELSQRLDEFLADNEVSV